MYNGEMRRLHFLRKLRFFNICAKMLEIFNQSVVASALYFAESFGGSSIRASGINRLNKLINKSDSIIGCRPDTFKAVVEREGH